MSNLVQLSSSWKRFIVYSGDPEYDQILSQVDSYFEEREYSTEALLGLANVLLSESVTGQKLAQSFEKAIVRQLRQLMNNLVDDLHIDSAKLRARALAVRDIALKEELLNDFYFAVLDERERMALLECPASNNLIRMPVTMPGNLKQIKEDGDLGISFG